jgi:hypothetical protein
LEFVDREKALDIFFSDLGNAGGIAASDYREMFNGHLDAIRASRSLDHLRALLEKEEKNAG